VDYESVIKSVEDKIGGKFKDRVYWLVAANRYTLETKFDEDAETTLNKIANALVELGFVKVEGTRNMVNGNATALIENREGEFEYSGISLLLAIK